MTSLQANHDQAIAKISAAHTSEVQNLRDEAISVFNHLNASAEASKAELTGVITSMAKGLERTASIQHPAMVVSHPQLPGPIHLTPIDPLTLPPGQEIFYLEPHTDPPYAQNTPHPT